MLYCAAQVSRIRWEVFIGSLHLRHTADNWPCPACAADRARVGCPRARGRLICREKFRAKVEAVGARFAPYHRAYDYDDSDYDAAFPGRAELKGLDQIKFDFTHVFMKQIGPQHHATPRR